MTKEAILHKHCKFWNHKGEVAVDGIDTLTPESAILTAMQQYADQKTARYRKALSEIKNMVLSTSDKYVEEAIRIATEALSQ